MMLNSTTPVASGIRLVKLEDAPALLEIYAPLVVDTAITFEFDVPTLEQFRARIERITTSYPWLVAELDGGIVGFAYAGPHRARPAYQWSVEVSVYVDSRYRRRGVARSLYEALFALLERQGFRSAYAGVALPNDPSVALHLSLGFEPIGVFKAVGYKLGKWRDTAWFQRQISRDLSSDPALPRRPEEVAPSSRG